MGGNRTIQGRQLSVGGNLLHGGGGGLYSIYEGGKMTRGNLDHTTPEYI